MSESSLSQNGVDALLAGAEMKNGQEEAQNFSPEQINRVKEISQAFPNLFQTSLSTMITETVGASVEDVFVSDKEKILTFLDEKILDLSLTFTFGLSGGHFFVANEKDILPLATALVGQEITALEGAPLVSFSELFFQVGQGVAQHLMQILSKNVAVGTPNAQVAEKGLSRIPSGNFLVVKYKVTFQGNEFFLYEIFDAVCVQSLDKNLEVNNMEEKPVVIAAETVNSDENKVEQNAETGSSSVNSMTPNVKGVQLPNLTPTGAPTEAQNISLLMDVSMELTVELGRTRWQVKDILGMGEGTIVELEKLAGEPVDILVNHNLIARGEVVVIDENFGVRVTEIVSNIDKVTKRS